MQVIELINALDKLPEDAVVTVYVEGDDDVIDQLELVYDQQRNEVVFKEITEA